MENMPVLCLLIGANDEQKQNYLNFIGKHTDAVFTNHYADAAYLLTNGDYVITEDKYGAVPLIKTAKEFGAEVVGVFFNNLPKLTGVEFDKVYLH